MIFKKMLIVFYPKGTKLLYSLSVKVAPNLIKQW